jgi:hypothetical protein
MNGSHYLWQPWGGYSAEYPIVIYKESRGYQDLQGFGLKPPSPQPSPPACCAIPAREGPGMRARPFNKIDNSSKNNQKHYPIEVFLQFIFGSSLSFTVYF